MTEALADKLDAYVHERIAAGETPGVSLALTDATRTTLVRAYGKAREGTPWTPDIRGQIGSISKSFCAVCIVALAEQGKLDLDAPVERYLPWFRYGPPNQITLHHLLTHTAGLPMGTEPGPPSRVPMALLPDCEPCWKPGERMWYSNTGYATLGLVVEAVTGQTAAEAVTERVMRPLGMRGASAVMTYAMRPTLPDGYGPVDPEVPWKPGDPLAPEPYIVSESADGSIVATAEELTAFVRLLLAGEADGVVSRQAFANMIERTELDEEGLPYGYGLGVEQNEGTLELSHSGGMVGHHSFMTADVGRGLGVGVLINGPTGAFAIAEYAMALQRAAHDGRALPEPAPAKPDDPPRPADHTEDIYAGLYRSHNPWSKAVRMVREQDGTLGVRLLDVAGIDQVGEHRFRGRDALGPLPEYVEFDLPIEGKMQRVTWNGNPYYRAIDQ